MGPVKSHASTAENEEKGEAQSRYRENQQSASTAASTPHPIDSENDAKNAIP